MMRINRSTSLMLPKLSYHDELLAKQAKTNLLDENKVKTREDFHHLVIFLRRPLTPKQDLMTFVREKSIKTEETLLHILCQESDLLCSAEKEKIASVLLRAGAEVNAQNQNEETPMDIAKKNKDNSLITILKESRGMTKDELKEWKITAYEFFNDLS